MTNIVTQCVIYICHRNILPNFLTIYELFIIFLYYLHLLNFSEISLFVF